MWVVGRWANLWWVKWEEGVPAFLCDFPVSGCGSTTLLSIHVQNLRVLLTPISPFYFLPHRLHETDPIPLSTSLRSLLSIHYFNLNHCVDGIVDILLNSIFHTPIRSSKKFQGLIIDSPLWQIVFSKESITEAPVSRVLTMWSGPSSHQKVEPVASSWTWRGLRPSRNDGMWLPRLGQEKGYSFCLVLLGNLLSDPWLPYSKGRCTVRKPQPHGDAMYRCS